MVIDDGSAAAGSDASSKNEVVAVVRPLPEDRYDLRILSSLRRIVRSIDSHSRRLAVDFGMTVPQLLCMLKLKELGPVTVKELAQEVFLNASTTVGIVDRLERSGLLERERSKDDRRRVRILLTERGAEMVGRAPSPLQQGLVDAIDGLPETERATIAISLERIVECITNSTTTNMDERAAPVLETSEDLNSMEGISSGYSKSNKS